MTENTNNFSNRNVAFISVAVIAIFAGIASMLFVNTEPTVNEVANTEADVANDIETIEVVAEPNVDDDTFGEANNIMTDNHEH
jgi:hypothetical protein